MSRGGRPNLSIALCSVLQATTERTMAAQTVPATATQPRARENKKNCPEKVKRGNSSHSDSQYKVEHGD